MTGYAIRGGEEGKRRLDLLAATMAPNTEALLARAGVRNGMRCIDLGCGGGHVSRYLAECAGHDGFVVGLDIDDVKLAAARNECAQAGLRQIQFRAGSVTTWTEQQAYDLVYGRFILSHLPNPAAIVKNMTAGLRRGGVLVLEDIDFGGAFCHPPNAAYERYCSLYRAVIDRRGGNAELGRELYGMCLDAGLIDVEVDVVQPTHGGGEPEKALSLSTLINIADAVVSEGLASADEIAEVIAELTRYTSDPRAIVSVPRIFQVWGRVDPASA
jgi:predicted O-methyltransferase YrrM